jgi:glycosyltransferase involved in cell wall biosynthesis
VSKHVAFVLAGVGAGGAERVIALLSTKVIERGWTATIISFDRPDAPVYHDFHPDVHFVFLGAGPNPRASNLMRTARRFLALRKALADGQFQLVVSFLTKINVLTLLASHGLGLPVIVSERNNPLRQKANPMWGRLVALLYRRAGAIVLQTDRSRTCLPSAERERAHVIANPIALPSVIPETVEYQITAVGRLEDQKGFDMLIDAFARLAPSRPQWKLVIWGEGPLRKMLTERSKGHGLDGQVVLPGLSATHGAWINPGQIFVLCSRYEGFPNVLGEAMAGGMAAAAFDCDFGPSEMIVHGQSGLLVPPENVDALTEALEQLMDRPELCHQLARKAAQSASALTAECIGKTWLTLMDNIC